ncbi:putative xenobiotic-transporting ATPase [Medicago truncatula]|uniref:Putative xenobiotic-transporting ATPase n=1 Tax=Medicago truncatula TaxID=3880 RepID=A0A396GGD3_MEDTR|nr:putative xenobiotic-transporting ATPase [Medicago truncatula]
MTYFNNTIGETSEPLLAQKVETKQTELSHATFLSKLIFSWVNSLLSLGYTKALALEDIPSLVSEDEADMAYQKFAQAWESLVRERTKNDTKSLVLWSIVRSYLKENILIAFYALIRTIAVVVSPLILYAFVNYSNRTEEDLKQGLSIVGFLVVTKVFESLSQRHWFFNSKEVRYENEISSNGSSLSKAAKAFKLGKDEALGRRNCELHCS